HCRSVFWNYAGAKTRRHNLTVSSPCFTFASHQAVSEHGPHNRQHHICLDVIRDIIDQNSFDAIGIVDYETVEPQEPSFHDSFCINIFVKACYQIVPDNANIFEKGQGRLWNGRSRESRKIVCALSQFCLLPFMEVLAAECHCNTEILSSIRLFFLLAD